MIGKRKRLIRRLLRVGLACAIVLAAAVTAAYIFRNALAQRFVVPRVESAVSAALGLDVRIEGVELGAFGQLEVVGLTSRGDHPSTGILDVGFDRLTVVFSPWGAIRGRPDAVEKIVLVAPRLDIQLDAKPLLPSFDQGAPRPPESGPHQLPSIEIAGADVRLRTKVDSLHLTGVDFRLDGTEIRLDVRGAEGDWRPPRFEAVPQPIEARVRCVGSTEPWDEIALDTLSLGGREYARDLRVDLREAGVVKFYGDLPGWGARLTAGSVVGDILDLTFRGDGGDLKPIVALFTDWPVPHARATGDFRLVLPLDELKSWQASTDMELTEIRWPEYSLTALDAHVTGRRGRDGLLAGEALLISVAWQGSAAVDLHGPFRVQDIGEPGGFEAAFDAGFVSPAGGRGDVAARIQEIGLVVRDGRLHIDDLSGEDLASFGLAGGLSSTVHAASLDASFDGPIAEPAAWSGRAALRAAGSHWEDGESVRASAQATLGSCVLRLDPLQVETCEVAADVRVAVSFDPARTAVFVAADELRGVIGGTSFEVGPPVVFEAAARSGGFVARLEPALAWGLGGGGLLAASAASDGGLSAALHVDGVDLARVPASWRGGENGFFSVTGGVFAADVSLDQAVLAGLIEPRLEVEASVREASVEVVEKGSPRIVGGVAARLIAEANGSRLLLHEISVARDGMSCALRATVPLRWEPLPVPVEGEPFEASVRADLTDLAMLPFLHSGFRDLSGRVIASGSASGRVSFNAPDFLSTLELSADATLLNAVVKRLDVSPPITDASAQLHLEGRVLRLEQLTAKMYNEPFHAIGEVRTRFPWDIGGFGLESVDIRLDSPGALLVRQPKVRARGKVDLRLSGTPGNLVLGGAVDITRAYYLQDVSLAPRRGAKLPLSLFSFRDPPLDTLQFNVTVRSTRGIAIRNNVASTRATADLLLQGTGEQPLLTGTISTDEGFVRFAETPLKLRSSYVELVPQDPMNPRLQIVFGERFRVYEVTCSITGTLEDPEVLLDSSPPLEREKILVLITTGMTIEEVEDRGVSRVAAVKAAKYVGHRLARYFSSGDPTETSFFERFSVETESAQWADQEDPIRVEYRLIEHLIRDEDELFLQGERDEYGDYNFNLGVRFELY